MAPKRTNAADNQSSKKQRKTKKKIKAPPSFLDATTLLQVVDFPLQQQQEQQQALPEHDTVKSDVVSDVIKEVFLDRFVKEIVKPFAPDRNSNSQFVVRNCKLRKSNQNQAGKKTETNSIWNQRIRIGTNQCLRILDAAMNGSANPKPLLCVCARDVYPPTMLTQVPVVAKKLKIPLVILGGKATTELGEAIGLCKASIVIILESSIGTDESHGAIDSFCSYARTLVDS
ncbi:unnamed protein product [Cylindrotheca closterium]|uniref:Ribosomal protein L7Ae/L30e/S12e/Gadd45 domain-containing protein n=1 Tax=Cylindrotheca closterium TaxID=2856 RepID=A0AAD2CB66_9STRA|nr:unnamed protein product [Cylindrotheca closterium]